MIVIPPAGQGWQQTSTIEGKKLIDAWVKANEPTFFAEFGPPGWHAFVGFTKEFGRSTSVLNGGSTISGQVVNNHLSRPPDTAFYNGAPFPHTTPWVGLNADGGQGEAIYVQRTDNGAFIIPGVPPGNYQLAVLDDNLDLVFDFKSITVNADGSCATPNGSCNVGNVPAFEWFSQLWLSVFNDENENGFWDGDEVAIPETATAIQWRDGTLYQGFPTDGEGSRPSTRSFPSSTGWWPKWTLPIKRPPAPPSCRMPAGPSPDGSLVLRRPAQSAAPAGEWRSALIAWRPARC